MRLLVPLCTTAVWHHQDEQFSVTLLAKREGAALVATSHKIQLLDECLHCQLWCRGCKVCVYECNYCEVYEVELEVLDAYELFLERTRNPVSSQLF